MVTSRRRWGPRASVPLWSATSADRVATVVSALQRSMDERRSRTMGLWLDDQVEADDGPWALGDDDPDPLARWDDDDLGDDEGGDGWLDDALRRVRAPLAALPDEPEPPAAN